MNGNKIGLGGCNLVHGDSVSFGSLSHLSTYTVMDTRAMSSLSPKKRKLAIDTDDEVACGVCTSPFVNPASLPCGHVFCTGCLAEWATKRDAGANDRIPCPSCRTSTRLSDLNACLPLRILAEKVAQQTMSTRERSELLVKSDAQLYDFKMHVRKTEKISRLRAHFTTVIPF